MLYDYGDKYRGEFKVGLRFSYDQVRFRCDQVRFRCDQVRFSYAHVRFSYDQVGSLVMIKLVV